MEMKLNYDEQEIRRILTKYGIGYSIKTCMAYSDEFILGTQCPKCREKRSFSIHSNKVTCICGICNYSCTFKKFENFLLIKNVFEKLKIQYNVHNMEFNTRCPVCQHMGVFFRDVTDLVVCRCCNKEVSMEGIKRYLEMNIKGQLFEFPIKAERKYGVVDTTQLIEMDFSRGETRIAGMINNMPKIPTLKNIQRMNLSFSNFGIQSAKAGEQLRIIMGKYKDEFFIDNLKGECKMVKGQNERIKLQSIQAFDPEELSDMVSRKYPFMYTKGVKPEVKSRIPVSDYLPHLSTQENEKRINRSKADIQRTKDIAASTEKINYHNVCVCIFVHRSIVQKAIKLGIKIPYELNEAYTGNYYFEFPYVEDTIKQAKDFFKHIRSAQWPGKTNIDVLCTYEEI